MEERKSKFDRDNTLIWVLIGLLICITIQLVGVMHLKDDIKEKESVIKKLETIKRDTAEIDSLKSQIKNLEEWIADEDERCAVSMDQLQNKITQYEYDKNNSK
jgi:peptidoglycan hydrolase CwlO-like protein